MKKHLFPLLLALATIPHTAISQIKISSPAAAEFVRYERIPVSYFNGLPNIEIPIYKASSGDLELPVSISYHASGIQVGQHPTCVGLGWQLNAGGGITRVINGRHDECTWDDYFLENIAGVPSESDSQPGYLYYSQTMDIENWTDQTVLENFWLGPNCNDSEPDEFIINACGLSASIWFYRDNSGQIKSKIKNNNGVPFTIKPPVIGETPDPELSFPSSATDNDFPSYFLMNPLFEFTVIKNDGTELVFGGDYDAIEFFTEPRLRKPDLLLMKTIPSTWMLRKITTPQGHVATFEYKRNGSPVTMTDVRTDLTTYNILNGVPTDVRFFTLNVCPEHSSTNYANPDRGKSFIIGHPVYLEKIVIDNNLTISFDISKSNDLSSLSTADENYLSIDGLARPYTQICYNKNNPDMTGNCAPHNYSCKLDGIRIESKGTVFPSYHFTYTENTGERLKLNKMMIQVPRGQIEQTYTFEYDTKKLPQYTATLSDAWGYYNGKNYRDTDIENDFFGYRSANLEYAMAESLTSITYPTGGSVNFTYELNDYSRIAMQSPEFKLQDKCGTSGGLRIKEMTYTDKNKKTVLKHGFRYVNENGTSSGILSGVPVYVSEGEQSPEAAYKNWNEINPGILALNHKGYRLTSESHINILGLTSGRHTTYSRVVETIGSDKPLTKEYRYTNHDSFPDTLDYNLYTNIDDIIYLDKFTSKSLERGLLTDEIWYGANNVKIKHIHNTYRSDAARYDEFVKSIQNNRIGTFFSRIMPYKILAFYPYLESKTTTEYDTSGNSTVSSVNETWTYNSRMMPVAHTVKDNNGKTITTTTTYADKYQSGPYTKMQSKGMFGLPVESTVYTDGKIVSGEINEYALHGNFILPSRISKLELDSPADSILYQKFNGSVMDSRYIAKTRIIEYDTHGNPAHIILRNGDELSYIWDSKATQPVFAAKNATNTYKETTIETPVQSIETIGLNPDNPSYSHKEYSIKTSKTGNVTINLEGMLGYDWFVSGTFDGKPFQIKQMRSGKPFSDEWELYSGLKSSVVFNSVNPGIHTLKIQNTAVRKQNEDGHENGSMAVSYWGTSVHTEISGNDEFLFEDFENTGSNGIYPFGFHSRKCFVGPYKISMSGNSDRKYIIDYQVYLQGKWQYRRRTAEGRNCVIDEGINPIDNVRVFPADAEVTSYTWIPYVGMSSSTDMRGITTSYEYDCAGRLKYIKDNNGNIIRHYSVNYGDSYGQPYTTPFTNEEMEMEFISNACDLSLGYVPKPIKYVVPAYAYTSIVSQDEANRMAFTDILMNGQVYADQNGTYEECIIINVINLTGGYIELEMVFGLQGSLQYRHYTIAPMQENGPDILYIPKHNYRLVSATCPDGTQKPVSVESGSLEYYDNYFPGLSDTFIIR